ncbi:protein-methionine sulfoxide oxidase mical3a-like isoform X2 [Notolabrus celidotus]|uniref:protein-methionine sulfoxide oxidase mical3a-like isoform X2 n=1 Tax=Notolabrus celidotus TaxID=1203425 RepID=UPI00148FD605|nr:protein-methionine sulfoxide oxidase mical3a-like isoform X2 [Notolabrus celidotus]
MGDESFPECRAQELFDEFVSASTCRAVLWSFGQLCEHLRLDRSTAEKPLYRPIKKRLNYWKANPLWSKLDRRAAQTAYMRARACSNTTVVIIGAGPCGLRTAVELGFMGARVVLLEKRDSFSRNNVLHLWPYTIHDLRGLGAKKFYGKFCAGSIDHISIRQLQLILLKVALLLGVEVHVNVEFKKLVEPPEDQSRRKLGWRMEVSPKAEPLNQLEFDVIIGADGRRNTLPGFRRKEFRGKLAIAITANFKNRNTTAEAKVEEISGVAFIFNQRFFQELRQETGIDLENIVYYKDDTHYFVMTAKKQSLLDKGVILQDFADTEQLLSRCNVDQNALQAYAREAANFSTNHQLPSLDFAMNHYGQPDVAMFDFTCMYASENAAMVCQRNGHQLLVSLVGDSLLEPFWPMGTGIARGFLAALDSAWMIRSWSQGGAALDVLAERESVYRLLAQTTPENLQKNFSLFTVDPTTRYPNINTQIITPAQVRHLVNTGEGTNNVSDDDIICRPSSGLVRQSSVSQSNKLLSWCQDQTQGYHGVSVSDLTTSWKSGLALCALIHRYRPDLIDFDSLDKSSVEENTRLGFDVAEREFGISPLMTVEEMSLVGEPDSLSMVMYLIQFYQLLKDTPPPAGCLSQISDLRSALIAPASLLSRMGLSPSRKRNPKELREARGKRRKTSQEQLESCDLNGGDDSQVNDVGGSSHSKVRLMANQLQAKLEENSTPSKTSSASSSVAATRRQQGELVSLPQSPECPSTEATVQPSSWRPRKRTLQQEQLSFRFKEKIRSQSALSGKEQTSEVSSLAEQITNQIQSPEEVTSSSGQCYFCKDRVYLMERLSAEGLFFHRTCFQCFTCNSALRLAAYTFDHSTGRFYCLQNCDSDLNAPGVRRRTDRSASLQTSTVSLSSAPSLCSANSLVSLARRRSSAVSMKTATPERIELENYRCSSTTKAGLLEEGEEPEEVSEEVLNRFNLDLDLDLAVEKKPEDKSSSESEMEEEDEEVGATWRETLLLHLRRNKEKEEEEEGEEDEEEDEEEEGEMEDDGEEADSEMESSDGSDIITHSSTPVEPDSTSSHPSFTTNSTPLEPRPHVYTPSTSSFITIPDSTHDDGDSISPTLIKPFVITEDQGPGKKHSSSGRGSFDDISPEVPPLKQDREAEPEKEGLQLELEGVESEVERWRRRHKGAHTLPPRLPPLQAGSGSLLRQLKGVKEAPPTRQLEMDGGGARALLRAVFSGNRMEKRKKKRGATLPVERMKKEATNHKRGTGVWRGLTEESDLESSVLLHRCSLNPRTNRRSKKDSAALQDSDGHSSCPTEVVGVLAQPKEQSSLSVKETLFQRGQEEDNEDLDAKITRRVQRAARRTAKQDQLKRLHKAQMIQRQLQQVEEKQGQLEERGVMVEKALRGEADYWGENDGPDLELHLEGLGKLENPALMQQLFQLVQQKNSLLRYESELMIFARELELEDRQSRLQQELRERMAVDDHLKAACQLVEERLILEEMLEVVEQRDALVSLLEEQRLQERQEDQDLEQVMMAQGLSLSWN